MSGDLTVEGEVPERDSRVSRAEAVLWEGGVEGARVRPAGHDGAVAAVAAAPRALSRVAELAPAIRECGFRWVALELEDRDPGPVPGPEQREGRPTGRPEGGANGVAARRGGDRRKQPQERKAT